MRRWILMLTGLALVVCGTTAVSPAPAKWETSRAEPDRKSLPKGKTLRRYASPGGRMVLVLRDEGEHGDFFWRSIYVQKGKSYTPLGSCNKLERARWTSDSGRVRFRMDRAVGPTEMDTFEAEYTTATRALRTRVVAHHKVQGGG